MGCNRIRRNRSKEDDPEGIMSAAHAELVAVYDIDPGVNRAVARKYNVKAADSIQELLDSDIEAVYISSPVNMHLDHAVSCAGRKKHVFCEKPLGLTVEEAEKMIRVCEQEKVLLGTGLMMRFTAQHQAALKMIRNGLLGQPVYGRAQLSCWYPPIRGAWRQDPAAGGGGSLMDMGSHCIDLLEMFFGKAKRVHCFINNTVHDYRSEDTAVVSLFFENGAVATVDSCFCIPDNSSKNILELYGSKGSILARGTIGQLPLGEMTAYLETENGDYDAVQNRNRDGGISIDPAPVNAYCAEIEDFSLAVIEGREPFNSAESGLRSQKVLAACYLSASSGETVNI